MGRGVLDKIHNLIFQNKNLRETRDLLLPKLILGEVDISELDIETERLKPEKGSANSLSVDNAIALRAEIDFA